MTDFSDTHGKGNREDVTIGGFTLVRDKLKYKKLEVKEVLPFWITSPVLCSKNFDTLMKVKKSNFLDKFLCKNLKTLGIKCLFPVQSAVIPYFLNYYQAGSARFRGQPRDICISAPTGSGKTLAYALPIVQLLNSCSSRITRAVIVLPVRDLARQSAEMFRKLILSTNLRVTLLAGEVSFIAEQADLFAKSDTSVTLPDIIVCTPGRLVDHIYNTPGFCLEHVRFLVIDEADRVIVEEKQDWYNVFEGAFYGVMQSGDKLKRRKFPLPTIESQCEAPEFTLHKVLLSATLTHDPEPLERFHLNFPRLFLALSDVRQNSSISTDEKASKAPNEELSLSPTHKSNDGGVGVFTVPSGLKEFIVEIPDNQKPPFLVHLLRKLNHPKVLCFTNSRETTKRLAFLMSHFGGVSVSSLNAGMPLTKRSRILEGFANGTITLLICTDAVARGIDIDDVSCVVSYEPPTSITTYVHRIGRTARAGKTGVAYTLLLHNQVRFFKSDLRSVGITRVKKLPVHSSKLRPYQSDYQTALIKLKNMFQKRFMNSENRPGSQKTQAKRNTAFSLTDELALDDSVVKAVNCI